MSATIRTVRRSEWQRLAPLFCDYNYRQVWDFGVACAKRLNATSEHVVIEENQRILGLADVRIKHIPVLGGGIGYINGGPMVRRNRNGECEIEPLRAVLVGLVDHYVKTEKLVLRIQPPVGSKDWNDSQGQAFIDAGYTYCSKSKHYRTMVLDIFQPLEMVRKQFHQKWRNCLNNGEKKGLVVRTGTDNADFSTFIDLYGDLTDRKSFSVDLCPEFYRQVQRELPDQDKFLVSIIYNADEPVAGHVASILGDTCVYLLGATSGAGLKNKAAYIVQWSVIQEAKARGCRFYDLGGIDPEKNPGVFRFKKRMGGEDITAPGPFEYYPDGFRRMLVSGCEKLYMMLRGLRGD